MKVEITSRWNGSVLFSVEAESLKLAVEAAVKQKAYLAGAYLTGADLAGAYLAGANLAGTNLAGAYLAGTNLAGAPIIGGYPGGWRAHAWRDKAGALHVQVGCHAKTLAEARAYWTGKTNRREVVAFLDYVEAVAAVRWPVPAAAPAERSGARP